MKKLPSAKTHRIIKLAVSASLVLIISAICFIIPLRPSFSENEKRELAKFPTFSFDALVSGDYFSDISIWFSDTVPFRDTLMSINAKFQNFLGTSGTLSGFNEGAKGDEIPTPAVPDENATVNYNEPSSAEETSTDMTEETTAAENTTVDDSTDEPLDVEQMGNIVVCENSGYEYYNFVQSTADNYIKALNTAGARFSGNSDIYVSIAPSSIDITLNDATRAKLNTSDQKSAIEYMLGSINPSVKKFNCYNTIRSHKDEYVYFRTDHHWTALGAYYAYVEFCNAKGITPLSLSAFELWSFDGFLGTFYNDSGSDPALGATPDRVDAYKPPCNYSMTVTDKNNETYSMPLLYDETNAGASLKYSTFISGDNPLSVITNSDKTEGETCLVIKESYGNAFVPFLVYHYKTVYVIDYRHYSGSMNAFLSQHPVDDIIFMNNISMTRNAKLVQNMTDFIAG